MNQVQPAPKKQNQHHELVVDQVIQLTPNMRRLYFSGAALESFPQGYEGGYIKFLFDKSGKPLTRVAELPEEGRPVMRSFTVRAFDAEKAQLVVDAAMHEAHSPEDEGPAARWVKTVEPGAVLLVAGPGPVKLSVDGVDAYVMAADMTALPALSVNLAQLPPSAVGYCVIEVLSKGDIQDLAKPKGIEIHWVVADNTDVSSEASSLVSTLTGLEWPEGSVCTWAACEFNKMRAIRNHFRSHDASKELGYISSYWKTGRTDEEHKMDKRQDTES